MNFAVPADHRVKSRESEKRDKYLDLAREILKIYKSWRWLVIGTFGTITKGFVKGREYLENVGASGDHHY